MPDAQLSAMPDERPKEPKEPAPPRRTPGTDMQGEDAGTPDSGQPEGRDTPAEPALKQTSKTENEGGSSG